MHGQGLAPQGYNPIVDVIDTEDINAFFERVRIAVRHCSRMTTSSASIARRRRSRCPGEPARPLRADPSAGDACDYG